MNAKKIVAHPADIPSAPYGKYPEDNSYPGHPFLNPGYFLAIATKIMALTFPDATMPCANVLSLFPIQNPSNSRYCPTGINQCQDQEYADRPEWEVVPTVPPPKSKARSDMMRYSGKLQNHRQYIPESNTNQLAKQHFLQCICRRNDEHFL